MKTLRIRIEELDPQLDANGNFVRHNYIQIYEQITPSLDIQAVIAVVNGLPIPDSTGVTHG